MPTRKLATLTRKSNTNRIFELEITIENHPIIKARAIRFNGVKINATNKSLKRLVVLKERHKIKSEGGFRSKSTISFHNSVCYWFTVQR